MRVEYKLDYPSGGNYWNDFDEQGEGAYDLYQGANQDELGPDQIVDLGDTGDPPFGGLNPYILDRQDENNMKDWYPWTYPQT